MSGITHNSLGLLRRVPPSEKFGNFSPIPLFLITISGIFIAEVVAMAVVYFVPSLSYAMTTLLDAGIMVVLIFPLLYVFSFRPLIIHIEKLQQAERSLQQGQELQDRFFNSTGVMIACLDRDFNFFKVNDAYASSLEGRGPEFFLAKNYFVLNPDLEKRRIFRRVVETGQAYSAYEEAIQHIGQPERGTSYWNWSLQPVRGPEGRVEGVVLSLMDVTERKRVEQQVELERARLRSILDALPDGVYIVDQEYDVEYTNPVIEQTFGPVDGRKCYDYFHDREDACPWCHNPAVFEGRSAHWEWDSSKAGRVYDVFDTPLGNADGSVSKLKLIHDITSRKQAEAELVTRNIELQSLSLAERRQRQLAETLREAAEALSQSLDLDVVLRTLLTHLRSLVQCDTAGVMFPEGETLAGVRAVDGYDNWTNSQKILSLKVETDANPYIQKMVSTRRSVLIPNTAEDPDWIVYPGTELIHSHLFVPILVEDRLVGAVALGKFEPGYFTHDHVQWAEALVGEATVAIQNAWLFEQVRAGRERLQVLSRRLVDVQEKERVYIARELHDEASQTLSLFILGLGMLANEADLPPSALPKIAGLKDMTDQVLEELHRLAIDLRPASFDHLGLTPSVGAACQGICQRFEPGDPTEIGWDW